MGIAARGRVAGKAALVTGGARGLGAGTARLLAAEGARVVISDVNGQAGEATAASIRETGGEAWFVRHDVTVEADWDTAIETVIDRCGRLDVLVNNAGIVAPGPVETETLENWRRIMAVNLDGVFLGTRRAIAAMKGHGGSIVNISSIEGLVGEPMVAAYNASKGGVRIFTKSAALYCARQKYGIRVNSVHPGFIDTDMVREGFAALSPSEAEQMQAAVAADIPLGHMGEPEDIGYAVVYLASDESRYITGAELVVDGGYTAR